MIKRLTELKKAVEVTKAPLIEIIGDHRVLIENHRGITEYGSDRITVKERNGSISVTGVSLQLAVITSERIVIKGKILGVELGRGEVR